MSRKGKAQRRRWGDAVISSSFPFGDASCVRRRPEGTLNPSESDDDPIKPEEDDAVEEGSESTKSEDGPSMTADEEEALSNKLRELGYIE